MEQKNIMFFENDDKSYTMVDLYLNDRFLGYKDSYNYYDIDVNKKLLFKKSDNEYIIRYDDVNKIIIAPLQLKIYNFYNKLNTSANNNRVMLIYNDYTNYFIKRIDIWNNIIELIGINNPIDFVVADYDAYEVFIMADVSENTSFVVEDNYR